MRAPAAWVATSIDSAVTVVRHRFRVVAVMRRPRSATSAPTHSTANTTFQHDKPHGAGAVHDGSAYRHEEIGQRGRDPREACRADCLRPTTSPRRARAIRKLRDKGPRSAGWVDTPASCQRRHGRVPPCTTRNNGHADEHQGGRQVRRARQCATNPSRAGRNGSPDASRPTAFRLTARCAAESAPYMPCRPPESTTRRGARTIRRPLTAAMRETVRGRRHHVTANNTPNISGQSLNGASPGQNMPLAFQAATATVATMDHKSTGRREVGRSEAASRRAPASGPHAQTSAAMTKCPRPR